MARQDHERDEALKALAEAGTRGEHGDRAADSPRSR
jgi:hypothetical protein